MSQQVSTSMLEAIAPLAAPLPDPPAGDAFTPAQWTTLLAIMDTIVPAIHRESVTPSSTSTVQAVPDVQYNAVVHEVREKVKDLPKDDELDGYYSERASQCPGFEDLLKRTLVDYSRSDARKGLALVLSTLKYVYTRLCPNQNEY